MRTLGPRAPEEVERDAGYRYQPSYRHFIGTVEQVQRETNHNQIENIYHLLDIGVERQLTARWSVSASVPVLFAHRNQLYSPAGRYVVNGFGDASFGSGRGSGSRRPRRATTSRSA